jgi:hypothetical protein
VFDHGVCVLAVGTHLEAGKGVPIGSRDSEVFEYGTDGGLDPNRSVGHMFEGGGDERDREELDAIVLRVGDVVSEVGIDGGAVFRPDADGSELEEFVPESGVGVLDPDAGFVGIGGCGEVVEVKEGDLERAHGFSLGWCLG